MNSQKFTNGEYFYFPYYINIISLNTFIKIYNYIFKFLIYLLTENEPLLSI